MTIWARLTDPTGTVNGSQLNALNDKLSTCFTRMFQLAENGGNPFLFALSAPKSHYLSPDLEVPTAATDGKSYFWHPEFLAKLDYDEVPIVMMHESLHTAFFHPERMTSAQPRQRNWAMDYVVNGVIWHDHEKTKRKTKLWGGNLGDPIPLQELLDHIDGNIEAFGKDEGPRIFADKDIINRSPESIYDEIMAHWDKSPRKCPTCGALSMDPKTKKPKPPGPCRNRGPSCNHKGMCCPTCGSPVSAGGDGYGDGMPMPLDAHIEAKVSKQEAKADLLRAATQAKTSMRGTVPGEIEDELGELMKPTIKFTDLIRSACMKKAREDGLKNDWKRLRRRWLAATPRQYLPRRHTHRPRWLAMIDTSGSMSDADIAYGISQLQVVGNGSEGFVVPCDAGVNWDAVSAVKDLKDLKRVKIVGRGGTVFDDFFKEFPGRLGKQFDCVVVITDGDCGTVPAELAPRGLDVVWVLTRKQGSGWGQPFGRVVPLHTEGC